MFKPRVHEALKWGDKMTNEELSQHKNIDIRKNKKGKIWYPATNPERGSRLKNRLPKAGINRLNSIIDVSRCRTIVMTEAVLP